MGKRCFSKCRKVKVEKCTNPCSVIKNKYCRLASSLKMVKPDCRIVPKYSHNSSSSSSSSITSTDSSSSSNRSNTYEGSKNVKKSKKSNNSKNVTRKSIIKSRAKSGPKSGPKSINCLDTFCIGNNKLMDTFEFTNFKYVTSLKTIDSSKENINVLEYERNGYTAHAILKSNTKHNLAYEYMVGKFLQPFLQKVPSFVQTYGLYLYPTEKVRDKMDKNGLSLLVPLDPRKVTQVCDDAPLETLLVQHFKSKTLSRMAKEPHFFIYDALYVFYQIYFTLNLMRKYFTHYDLHPDNIVLYEPGGYIEYHYHLPKGVVHFKSRYLVKLINYGKSHFIESQNYYDKVSDKVNDQECTGFEMFKNKRNENPLYANQSQDLSLLKDYESLTKMKSHKNKYIQSFVDIFKDTVYTSTQDLTHDDKVRNVSDAELRFRALIQDPIRQRINDNSYEGFQKMGDLHVYTDKNMEYIPSLN